MTDSKICSLHLGNVVCKDLKDMASVRVTFLCITIIERELQVEVVPDHLCNLSLSPVDSTSS